MKKLLFPLLTILFLIACEKENLDDPQPQQEINFKSLTTSRSSAPKIDVCHHEGNDTWHVININENALPAHLAHGDVVLVDADGDGWVEAENECVNGGDCDDNDAEVNPAMEEVCNNGIDDNCNGEIDENCAHPCLDEAISQVSERIQQEFGGTDLNPTITGYNTFRIIWYSGRDGRDCIKTTAEATGDPGTGCGYTNLQNENVPCL